VVSSPVPSMPTPTIPKRTLSLGAFNRGKAIKGSGSSRMEPPDKGSTRYSCTSLQELTARVISLAHIAVSFGATYSSVAIRPVHESKICNRFRKPVAFALLLRSRTWLVKAPFFCRTLFMMQSMWTRSSDRELFGESGGLFLKQEHDGATR